MDFRILGPLEAYDEDRRLSLGGPKQRALLAVLLLARNAPVSRDRLIEALWGERPPATAPHTLDAYISRLRKEVGTDRLTRAAGTYSLRVEPGELDLDRFDELVAEGRELVAGGEVGAAAACLGDALALWRLPVLGDLVYEPFGVEAASVLADRWLSAVEDRNDAYLACGRAQELVGELAELVRANPFRERLLGQLMLALYRSGQQASALETYRNCKHNLAQELGLEPGAPLKELERAILAHDPNLAVSVRSSAATRPRRRLRRTVAVAGALVIAAAVAAVRSTGFLGRSTSSRIVQVAGPAAGIAHGFGSVWVADPAAGAVKRLDESGSTVVDRIPVGGTPGAVVVGGGSVWAASVPGEHVTRIDPTTGTITQTIGLGGGRLAALGFADGALWIADATDQSLLEIDADSGRLRRSVALSLNPTALAVADHRVWVADYGAGTVSEVDPGTGNVLATVRTGTGPSALAADRRSVWVANTLDSTVSRIDEKTGTLTSTVAVGSSPVAVVSSGRSIWVASQYPGSVARLDSTTGALLSTRAVAGSPTAMAVSGNRGWVAMQSLIRRRGGTVRLLHTRQITLDPAFQSDLLPLVSDGLTRDGLVTYAHVQSPAGTQLVPDLALAIPLPTNGGTVYTFRLRSGIRYSDGRRVQAADFRRALERTFRAGADSRQMFAGLVGAAPCNELQCDLSRGIVTDEDARTVTFRLAAPDPDLLVNLAQAAASPVPAGTPWSRQDSVPIPGTGPYVVAEADARRIVWTRNKTFREWSHAAQPNGNPDRIELRFGLQPDQEVREIEAGRADAMVDNLPAARLPSIQARYPSRLHSYVIPTTDFFRFNTTLAPFDDVRVRRAVNFALDRAAVVRLYGGSSLATVTCQILPPGMKGYRRYCPYTRTPDRSGSWAAPDLAAARKLVAASGTQGARVTVWGTTDDPTISTAVVRYVAGVIRSLGFRTSVHLLSQRELAQIPASAFDRIQVIDAAWGDTSPFGYVNRWFTCRAPSWFCNRQMERQNARAHLLEATEPRPAAALWALIDRKLVDEAAWLPMINERGIDFLSARVANYQSHPYWGILLDQLWVQR